jgi:hypothetical protein
VTGGSSIFLDSYRAVELLKAQHPEDYAILTKTPVSFHYINDGHHMYHRRPTIVTDDGYGLGPSWSTHVNYAPQFQGPMDALPPKEMKRFYQAYQRFADFVEDESLRYQITLQPGQLGKAVSLHHSLGNLTFLFFFFVWSSAVCQSKGVAWSYGV